MLALAGIVACGDDDADEHSTTTAGRSGQEGGSSGAKSGGSSGRGGQSAAGRAAAGSGGSTSSTGTADAAAVTCGTTTCASQGGLLGMFSTPCCADEATSTCGMSVMGNPCSVPSAGDPRCPSVSAFGGISVPGCCTADGMCGLDASMFGFGGCTELGSAAMQAGAMGGGDMTFPTPRRCDDVGGDAGVEDAGR